MSSIILATSAVTVIGVICAVMLAIASKIMHVPVDERVERIHEALPGANCGACGYAGCEGYAEALASSEGTATNLCIPGSKAVSRAISAILGVEFADVVEQVAVVKCGGVFGVSERRVDYEGIDTCIAAKQLYGGERACLYGCLGHGDCAAVCPNDAICIENGIAHIDTRRCIGCGMCAKACPKGIIAVVADSVETVVWCSSCDKGADTRAACSAGCIGCKKCERECPSHAIEVKNNLAVIDYDKCNHCDRCAEVCVTHCIKIADFRGIHNR